MNTIRHLILKLTIISAWLCLFGLQAENTTKAHLASITSQEMCMDEMFQISGTGDQSVLRTSYIDNGVEVKYEVVVSATGKAFVLKDNRIKVKELTYTSGDYFSANLKPTVLEIYQNSTLVFSKSITPTTVYHTTSSIIEDKLNKVEFDYIDGYCEVNGIFEQCANYGWGNAGFVSKNVLKQSEEGEIKWTVQEVDKFKMLGLGNYSTSKRYQDINYAVYQAFDNFHIYELGSRKVTGITVNNGDEIRIKKELNKIKYYINDQLKYTSLVNVTGDLYILNSAKSIGSLIHNVEASFTEDYQLYTTANVSEYSNKIKWNKLNQYAYDNRYKCMVSTSRTPHALSENYYQANLGHKPVVIKPDLSLLFTQENKARDVNPIIGLKEFQSGNFLEEKIPLDQVLCGLSFVGKKDGAQLAYIIENGSIKSQIPGYNEGDIYKILLSEDEVKIVKEVRGEDQIYYRESINPDKKYAVYQGSEYEDSPFLRVNVEGIKAAGFVKYNYRYEGKDELFKKHEGKIQDILNETGQSEIRHQIGWFNSTNVKGYNTKSTIRKHLNQEDTQIVATAESAFRFKPTDAFKISFTYSGGEYSMGSKTLFAPASNPFNSGFNISGGQIYLVNNGSNTSSVPIASGAQVTMLFAGNGTMALQVNGSNVGSPIGIASATLNLGVSLSQGTVPSGIMAAAPAPPPAPAAAAFVPPFSNFKQNDYNINCIPSNVTYYLSPTNNTSGTSYHIQIFETATFSIIESFAITANGVPNTVHTYNLTNPLASGVYGYYMNGNFEGFFEVLSRAEWNDDPSNTYVNNVFFDQASYNGAAESFLYPTSGVGGASIAKNEFSLPGSFSIKIPIIPGSFGKATLMDLSSSFAIHYLSEYNPLLGAIDINTGNGGSLVFTDGYLILDYIHLGGNQYEEYGYFEPLATPMERELLWNSPPITIPPVQLSFEMHYIETAVKNAAMSACSSTAVPPPPSIVDHSSLLYQQCGPTGKAFYNLNRTQLHFNEEQCPLFSLQFGLKNLEPSTLYRINKINLVGYGPILDYGDISLPLNGSSNYLFTTTSSGETPNDIVINYLLASDALSSNLQFELLDVNTNVTTTHDISFTVPDKQISELLQACFLYKPRFYNCLLNKNGNMKLSKNLTAYGSVPPITDEPQFSWSNDLTNTSDFNSNLETGCYTTGVVYNAFCGMPDIHIPYKIAAETVWSDLGGNVIGGHSLPTYIQPTNYIENTGGVPTIAKSLNALSYKDEGLIWYRNVYNPTHAGRFGYYNEETDVYLGVSIAANPTSPSDYSHIINVYKEDIGAGTNVVLNSTPITLKRFEFVEFIKENVNGTDETGGIRLKVNIYPELTTTAGTVSPRVTHNFNLDGLTTDSYQLFASPNTGKKLGDFGLNFCPPPVDKYFALMSRELHDGRHELKTCLDLEGYAQCPMEIKNDCEGVSELDLLKFKFDEAYYRSISPTEILDFEVRDYKNNILLSSADNLPNSIVKLGDNRYQLSMTPLNSTHPFYILIVKNAKNEKRYLRFKK